MTIFHPSNTDETSAQVKAESAEVIPAGTQSKQDHVTNNGNVQLNLDIKLGPNQRDRKLRFYTSLLCLTSLATMTIFNVATNICIVDMVKLAKDDLVERTDAVVADDLVVTAQQEPAYLDGMSSVKLQQLLYIVSLIGGQPMALISGSLADKYGSRLPMLIALITVTVTCLLTPVLTHCSLMILVISRFPLSITQATTTTSVYDFANRWLLESELSIFTSAVRVSFGIGAILGSLLPGVVGLLGYTWEMAFYLTGVVLALQTVIWYLVITSSPQDNSFITEAELILIQKGKASSSNSESVPVEQEHTPWLRIITHPSVIAHMIVKFTCELGLEIYCMEIAIYLREMHGATLQQISWISSIHSTIHVIFLTPIAWLSKVLIEQKALGFGKTAWRKIFQGSCHLFMATGYLVVPFVSQDKLLTGLAFGMLITTWMLTVGCEPQIPFDLTRRYPATIIGIVQTVSGFSMTFVTCMSSWILDGSLKNPESWNTLFRITGYALAFGGIVFVLMYKAELILPEELTEPQSVAPADTIEPKPRDEQFELAQVDGNQNLGS